MKRRTAGSWRPAPDNGRSRRGFTIKLLVRDITVALPFHHEVLSAFVVVEGHSAQSQDPPVDRSMYSALTGTPIWGRARHIRTPGCTYGH